MKVNEVLSCCYCILYICCCYGSHVSWHANIGQQTNTKQHCDKSHKIRYDETRGLGLLFLNCMHTVYAFIRNKTFILCSENCTLTKGQLQQIKNSSPWGAGQIGCGGQIQREQLYPNTDCYFAIQNTHIIQYLERMEGVSVSIIMFILIIMKTTIPKHSKKYIYRLKFIL